MNPEVLMQIVVGQTADAEFRGDTNAIIQAALDFVGARGGGEVRLQPGVFTLWDAVRLPSNTALIGAGAETVLRKADGWSAPMWEDGDWGDDWLCCDPAPPVRLGQGVTVESETGVGFYATVGTVVEIAGNRFRINARFLHDYMVNRKARVDSVHPLVAVIDAKNCIIRDLTIDGNGANNPRMNGCRGGAVYGLFGHGVFVSGVIVRHFHGDALSFQHSHSWTVEGCIFEDNLGGGMHPGSGSKTPVLRGNISRRNKGWGLFVCWRVKGALYEDNILEENVAGGIAIGHKDTDNTFRSNIVRDNVGPGIYTRPETFPMGPHRGLYETNIITGNNGDGAQVVLDGEVHDLVFRDNIYDAATPRFQVGPGVVNLTTEETVTA
jgi:hypothetical protein